MKPKIPLPPDAVNDPGLADTSGWPRASRRPAAISGGSPYRMRTVDPVTTELVRIRNARFQNCFF